MYELKVNAVRETKDNKPINLGLLLPEYIPNKEDVEMGIIPFGKQEVKKEKVRISIEGGEIDNEHLYSVVLYRQRNLRYKLRFKKSEVLCLYYR